MSSAPFNPSQSSSFVPSHSTSKRLSLSLSKRLFKPLISWRKSTSAPSSSVDNDSLYQLSSRESTQSAVAKPRSGTKGSEDFGSELSRWTSTGSVTSYASDSGKSFSRRPRFSSSLLNPLSRTSSVPSPQRHPSAKPGIRMLNGRIYGRKRPYAQSSTDPFANVQSQEPEFVEWGYGGMGSNKVNEHSGVGGRWKIVQGDGNTSAFGARSVSGDDEDASGMAWVRKRRQEREKLRKEKEEIEKIEPELGNSVENGSEVPPLGDKDQVIADEFKDEENTPKSKLSPLPSTTASTHLRPTLLQESSEHKHTAISLPPSAHKHHHPNTLKRDLSSCRSPIIQTPGNEDSNGLGLVSILDMELEAIASGGIMSEVGEKIDLPRHTSHREDSGDSASEDDSSPTDDDDEDDDDSDIESEVSIKIF
jgi:hypothetical protein